MFRRMPLSPTATGMVTASGNQLLHHHQQQQQYNNDMLGHHPDPNMFNQQQQQQQQQTSAGKPAGTITGMLADFSRALGKEIPPHFYCIRDVFFLRRA